MQTRHSRGLRDHSFLEEQQRHREKEPRWRGWCLRTSFWVLVLLVKKRLDGCWMICAMLSKVQKRNKDCYARRACVIDSWWRRESVESKCEWWGMKERNLEDRWHILILNHFVSSIPIICEEADWGVEYSIETIYFETKCLFGEDWLPTECEMGWAAPLRKGGTVMINTGVQPGEIDLGCSFVDIPRINPSFRPSEGSLVQTEGVSWSVLIHTRLVYVEHL